MRIIDEVLPGRSDEEERALRDLVRKVESARRKRELEVGTQVPQTDRGRLGRTERMAGYQQSVDAAMAALKAKLDELATERLALLPDDATNIEQSTGDRELRDDRRYPVVCTSDGQTISLGGCSALGPAQDRARWFSEAAKRKRSCA